MSQNLLELTEQNWASEVMSASQPVLVDFWAEWCGPCKQIVPMLEALAEEYGGRLKVGKVNVDKAPGLATQYGVSHLPTLLILKGGQVKDQRSGGISRDQLSRLVSAQMEGGAPITR